MAEEGKKKGGAGRLFGLIFVGLNVLVMTGGLFVIYANTLGYTYKKITEEHEFEKLVEERVFQDDEPILFSMEPFIINLSGFPRRVIKMTVSLEMLDEEGFEEIIVMGARARDSIVRLLNSKSFQELETIQGKLLLKDEISLTLNQSLTKGVIRDVYFSEFAVQ